MDSWKSSNELLRNLSEGMKSLLDSIENLVRAEVKKVEDMQKTLAYIKDNNERQTK